MKTSGAGRAAIYGYEGCRTQAYLDGANVPTIGIGHTRGVKMGDKCSVEQAQVWLTEDLEDAESAVSHLVSVPLQQHQFDALVSFTFNLGAPALARSTLLKKLNVGDYAGAADQFKLWNLCNSAPSLGLTKRRCAEADMFRGKP